MSRTTSNTTESVFVGAIDQGTSGTSFTIYDESGLPVSSERRAHEQIYPEPDLVEHDPAEIWRNTVEVITDAVATAGLQLEDLATIGIANQRETVVIWVRSTGEPIHNALVWQDSRCMDIIGKMADRGLEDVVQRTTGLELDPFYSAGEIAWLLENVEGARERAQEGELLVGTIDSWLVYNLTGVHATDVTNASRTLLFDIEELEWSERLLEAFDVPKAILPSVHPSSHPTAYGVTEEDGPLEAEIPVTGVVGDQQASLVGNGAVTPGSVKQTLGTSSVLQMHTGADSIQSENGLNTTVGYQISDEPAQYALEGEIFTGAQALEWLSSIGLIGAPDETDQLARQASDTGGVYFVPAFQGLATPDWDPSARGTIVGLTLDTSRAQLVRATLEGIAFRSRDAIEAFRKDTEYPIRCLRVDGGMVENDFLRQSISDFTQLETVRTRTEEATSFGAAFLSGLAVDVWSGVGEIQDLTEERDRIYPSIDTSALESRYEDWRRAVSRSMEWTSGAPTR